MIPIRFWQITELKMRKLNSCRFTQINNLLLLILAHSSVINNKSFDIVQMSLLQVTFILGKQYNLLFLNMLVTTSRKVICKK